MRISIPFLVLLSLIGTMATRQTTLAQGTRTVADRLHQYGEAARARLRPYFQQAQLSYPPQRLVFVGLKAEKRLQIYAGDNAGVGYRLVRAYPILAASGVAGPKLREGDRQVPEGIYEIESLNPNSRYHLSLRVSYQTHLTGRKRRRKVGPNSEAIS